MIRATSKLRAHFLFAILIDGLESIRRRLLRLWALA